MRKELISWFGISLCVIGCATESEDVDLGLAEAAIVDGAPTTDDPQVGFFWGPKGPCTATLIGPRAIITAAHCFDFASDPTASARWSFYFKDFTKLRLIKGYIALSTNSGDRLNDIAVAALDQDVDPARDGVFWSELGTQFPADGNAQLLWYGYGCGDYTTNSEGVRDCHSDSDFSVKRARLVSWWAVNNRQFQLDSDDTNESNFGTSGDSGGPLLDGPYIIGLDQGKSLATKSDGTTHKLDYFSNVVGNNARIRDALRQLGLR